ncbi:helix-turn-helix domain-containing protein [Capnocytophaga sputigena]|jgi:DNA binding domain, excisionase family|uniref:helix-turn-helix domain-containing protein n=1 Tax=Capnocytophaga sputigena TaxID=1019 RepID=UPI0028E4AB65|nr:helix-turn-helix domain-containing protein [Capnocytophaga sputigena]
MENISIVQNETLEHILKKMDKLEVMIKDLRARRGQEMLTHKEVQMLLKCSRNKLEDLVREGFIKKIQPDGKGRKVLFKRSEIEQYIESQNTQIGKSKYYIPKGGTCC